MVIDTYMHTGEPLSSTNNRATIEYVMRLVESVQIPFVWGADWQNDPQAMAASGLPGRLGPTGAHIVAPEAPTCSTGNILDYYLVDNRIRHWAQAPGAGVLHSGWPCRHHCPVGLALRTSSSPEAFPRSREASNRG